MAQRELQLMLGPDKRANRKLTHYQCQRLFLIEQERADEAPKREPIPTYRS
jgi:hypothetical protein